LGCRCLPSVNTICGRVMIGLPLSSVSEHNMWSYYDWVVVSDGTGDLSLLRYKPDFVINLFDINELYCIVCTDERQQRQPNHNTATYCVY
jgi:hypothetical protein